MSQYVRDYTKLIYSNSDGASNTTPTNYTNNIIANESIIKYSNADNNILKCSINHCTCNNENCKWIINVFVLNLLLIMYHILPFVNGIPSDDDVIMIDNPSTVNHVQFNEKKKNINKTSSWFLLLSYAPNNNSKNGIDAALFG